MAGFLSRLIDRIRGRTPSRAAPATPAQSRPGMFARQVQATDQDGHPVARPDGLFENKLDQIPNGWVSVVSSNINAIRYDKQLRAIDQQFKDGRIARYFNISPDEALLLLTVSHGKHHWDILRYRGKGNKHKHKKPWKYV